MRSRLLLNLFLLIVVSGLSWLVWKNIKIEEFESKPVQLALLDAKYVDRIQIRHRQRFTELVRQADGWWMKSPIHIRANDFRIGTLLKLLNSSSRADYDADDLDLEKYGLAQPETRIRFNDLSLAFGITNPVNKYRYVLVDKRVHLVEDNFYPLVSSQLGTLVALEMLPPDAEITRLQLPETELVRDEGGSWSSDSALSADKINETVSAWKNTQAFGVHDYMPREQLGFISITVAGVKHPIDFVVTDVDPWLIIARPDIGIEYHFNIEHYDILMRPGAAEEDMPADIPADVRREILEALGGSENKDPDAPW